MCQSRRLVGRRKIDGNCDAATRVMRQAILCAGFETFSSSMEFGVNPMSGTIILLLCERCARQVINGDLILDKTNLELHPSLSLKRQVLLTQTNGFQHDVDDSLTQGLDWVGSTGAQCRQQTCYGGNDRQSNGCHNKSQRLTRIDLVENGPDVDPMSQACSNK